MNGINRFLSIFGLMAMVVMFTEPKCGARLSIINKVKDENKEVSVSIKSSTGPEHYDLTSKDAEVTIRSCLEDVTHARISLISMKDLMFYDDVDIMQAIEDLVDMEKKSPSPAGVIEVEEKGGELKTHTHLK